MVQVIDASLPPDGITPAARKALEWADKSPYDDVRPVDAAHRAAQGILANLCGRRGVGDALEYLDADVKGMCRYSLQSQRLEERLAEKKWEYDTVSNLKRRPRRHVGTRCRR